MIYFQKSKPDDGENGKNRSLGGRIFDSLKLNGSSESVKYKADLKSAARPIVEEVKTSPSVLLAKYLEGYQLINQNSLCKKMMKIASIKPITFSLDQNLSTDEEEVLIDNYKSYLEEVNNLLVKLKTYLTHQNPGRDVGEPNQCSFLQNSKVNVNPSSNTSLPKSQSSIGTQTWFELCDKAIQCSKTTEFLKVSPQWKFLSRSSLLKNAESDCKSLPSLCKPELRRDFRSFSTSALLRPSLQKIRSKKRDTDRLKNTVRRTEDKYLLYTKLTQDDPVSVPSLQQRMKPQSDVDLPMKKILLEDYISEVKEIIRSESRRIEEEREADILHSVKTRMDQDLPMRCTHSWHSMGENVRSKLLTPCSSYESARKCPCCSCTGSRRESNAYCIGTEDRINCEALVLCTVCSNRARKSIERINGCNSCGEAKSSHSIDSGVQLDYPLRRTESFSSDEKTSSPKHEPSKQNDELLCQRVESAVRKFTEELILCERRSRDRSRSRRRRPQKLKRRGTPKLKHSSISNSPNYHRNGSDEEENIAEISPPSLVSLTDSEVPES